MNVFTDLPQFRHRVFLASPRGAEVMLGVTMSLDTSFASTVGLNSFLTPFAARALGNQLLRAADMAETPVPDPIQGPALKVVEPDYEDAMRGIKKVPGDD